MKQVLIRNGDAVVETMPAPSAQPGEVLVRVGRSCISVGTEMSGIQGTSEPLWKRALKRPDKVLKALNMIASRGMTETMNVVQGQLNTGLVVGYSVAGTVIGLSEGVGDLEIGQRVACGGAQAAHHAEIVRVPRNLVVPVPDQVELADAATVTMGAIAMQGVRRAEPTLGETFVVVGLGLLGQLTAQLLKSNGCHVIGIDIDDARMARGLENGLDLAIKAGQEPPIKEIARLTNGVGCDGVIVTAAGKNPQILGDAFKLCRRKGRVILVGDVPIQIERADIYRNELEFKISTSYGPGRYDRRYEDEGLEYPVSYVRWTENRNMASYLTLIGQGKVTPAKFIDKTYKVDDASDAYASLKADGPRPLGLLLDYTSDNTDFQTRATRTVVQNPTSLAKREGSIQVGVVSPGAFMQSVHLPNMASMKDQFQVRAVMSRTAHQSVNVSTNQRAEYATTEYDKLLEDPEIELIMIGSRHNLHASYTLDALKAGKHVFVEKPLALTQAEFDDIKSFYVDREGDPALPVLMIGFNRRFAPLMAVLKPNLDARQGPIMVSYRMNAGHIPLDHWVHGDEGGGRNIGEACHIYDLFNSMTQARLIEVQAASVTAQPGQRAKDDNFSATLRYDDGSIANLVYTALGDPQWPKEQFELFVDQKVFVMNDYASLKQAGKEAGIWEGTTDKGHKAELQQLYACLRKEADWPIPLWQQFQATQTAFDVQQAIITQNG